MAITQVGSITGPVTVVNADLTVTEPAGCQENDYLIVWIAHKSTVGYQALNGWTKLEDQSLGDLDATNGVASGELFYIKRGASAPTLVFTKEAGTGDVSMGYCTAFRGIDTGSPVRASTSTTAPIGATVATATALSASIGDLCFMGLGGGDNYTFSAEQINGVPTALDELADNGTNSGSDTTSAVATKILAAAIVSQTAQATCSSALGRDVIAVAYFKPTTTLVVADTTQSQVADTPALTQHNVLVVAGAVQAQVADNITVTAYGGALVVQDAVQSQTTDSIAFTQHHILDIPPPT